MTGEHATVAVKAGTPPRIRQAGLYAGLVLALLTAIFFDPPGLGVAGRMTAAIAVLMATWWISEAIPPAATAFLPIILFPVAGVLPLDETTARYAHPVIYLFFGGFVVALAIERCGLHRRAALTMMTLTGSNGRALVGGFMVTAAAISMWISNTSTTLMLIPIALSILLVIREEVAGLSERERGDFEAALLLGVAYGATLGGIATLVGTPPNALMVGFMADSYQFDMSFARWMLVGLPVTIVMLPIAWFVLTRIAFKVSFRESGEAASRIAALRAALGPVSSAERRVGLLFLALVLGWLLRLPLSSLPGLGAISDTGIAMTAALLAFIIPAKSMPGALMGWEEMKRLPWGVLLLFGGGLALAAAMTASGLTQWIGEQLSPLAAVHLALLVIAATGIVILLTELTSNLATTATFLPVMAAIAGETGHDPLLFIVPVTLAASCAFMLPVATAPNAISFSTGRVTTPQMMRAGLVLNLVGVALLSVVALTLAPAVFG